MSEHRSHRTRRWLAGIAGVVLAASGLAATRAGSTSIPKFMVACDATALQTAIMDANTAGSAQIKLAPSCIYSVLTPATATEAFPVITGSISIVGGKNTILTRDPAAASDFRLFSVDPGATLSLRKLTLENGRIAGLGGAISVAGTLTAKNVTLTNNVAGNGGGVAVLADATATIASSALFLNATTGVGGGALINSGTLTVRQTTFSTNVAPVNGGAINTQSGGTTTLVKCTLRYNRSGALGGAVSNLGTTTITSSTIRFNTGSAGGAVATANASVSLTKSTIADNLPDNCSPLNTIAGCAN